MAAPIMIQGTMSNAGKSVLAGGLCRVFHQDGYQVAPFKSQNMALNSFITREGLEMGRAQVMQAEAAGIEPLAIMNPILLKPTNDTGSQVILNGEVQGVMSAMEYFRRKREYIPVIKSAYQKLDEQFDIIVIEGAGSPAEINLKREDIVNMGIPEERCKEPPRPSAQKSSTSLPKPQKTSTPSQLPPVSCVPAPERFVQVRLFSQMGTPSQRVR